jgi:hypothetical protein
VFCADLRREINWGSLDLEFLGVLGVGPRGGWEGGGSYGFSCAFWDPMCGCGCGLM